jgi:hypothetical protein
MYIIQHTYNEKVQCASLIKQILGPDYDIREHGTDLVVMKDLTPSCNLTTFTILKDKALEINVWFSDCVIVRSKRVDKLLDIQEKPIDYVINSDSDFSALQTLLNVEGTIECVSDTYHEFTGCEVVDHRDSYESEFTNVNAQRDRDFYAEEPITG